MLRLNSAAASGRVENELLGRARMRRLVVPRGGNNGSTTKVIPPSSDRWVFERMPLRDHVLGIAESMQGGGWDRVRYLLELLSRRVSARGDSEERLAACFFEALAVRFAHLSSGYGSLEHAPVLSQNPTSQEKFSAYIALDKVTPFLRFAHLTTNQALLEALTGDGEDFLHIIDMDIGGNGAQWASFLQALATKRSEEEYSIKRIRITGISNSASAFECAGSYLTRFADELGLPFEFIPLVQDLETLTPRMLDIQNGEAVGVNCVMRLHTLLTRDSEMLTKFLAMVESVTPKVVTVAEAEANLNAPYFLDRFRHAWGFYGRVFDALDATLPRSSVERAQVERDWYQAEIRNVVAFEESERTVRHQRFKRWLRFFEGNGFEIIAPSRWALSQAQFLLKRLYPADGYKVVEKDGSVVLGWHEQPLFAVSAWKLAEIE